MSAQHQPGRIMIGDLPLVESSRFMAPADDDSYWSERGVDSYEWNIGEGLVFLQHHLFEEQQERDVELDSNCLQEPWEESGRNKIPFHPDVLPHWEAFAAMKEKQGGVQSFQIRDIMLPPAPFVANKLMPALKSSNDSLVRLDLVACKLGPSGLGCVADFLTDNASVAALDLSYNKIGNVKSAKFFALAIWNHPELQFVNLSHCAIGGTRGVLAEVLGGAGNLETLLLEENAICSEGMALIANFIAANTAMTTLSLADNHVDKHKESLFTFMEIFDSDIDLSDSDSSDSDSSDSDSSDSDSSDSDDDDDDDDDSDRSKGKVQFCRDKDDGIDNAWVIGKALKENTSIRQLSLRHCSGMDIPTFVKSKRSTELLTNLDLSHNKIGKEGGETIADYLARNPALVELNLQWNGLTSRSAKALADALKSNNTLEQLDLDYNRFNDDSVPLFAGMLRNNTTLLLLSLISNNIRVKTGARKELIKKALCDTSSLAAIVESNHTCELILCAGKGGDTHEEELCNINVLKNEAEKIRYKVVLALFAMDSDLFSPRTFDDVPLELLPRLLHLVQQEIGYGGFGEGVVEKTRKRRKGGFNPTLRRVHEVVSGWNQLPLLFARGPGKPKKKRKRHVMSYKDDEDEDWTPGEYLSEVHRSLRCI